jgi:predicted transcriptional regulator
MRPQRLGLGRLEVPRELIGQAKMDADGNLTLDERRKEKLEPITFEELIKEFQSYLYMPDITPIKVMLATVLANRVPGDMVWMFIVAPPSSAKTELLTALFQSPEIVSITGLTQNTLISGFMGPAKDYSLLPKLKNKILVIKDFTGVLTMAQQARDAVFGQLRDAYDRRSEKVFGHGVHKIYKDVHFGILAGVTNTIENINIMQQTLGERFVRYYLPVDNSEDLVMKKMRKAFSNVSFEPEKQIRLQLAVKRFLGTFEGTSPEISEKIETKLIFLARLVARMRGIVPRDFKGDKILYKPQSEGPMRVGKQLLKMAVALANLEGKKEVGEAEFEIVKQIALGSCPSRVESIVKYLYEQEGKPNTYQDILKVVGFNYATIKGVMEDLLMLNIVTEKGYSRKKYYTLSDETNDLVEKGAVFSKPKKRKEFRF